MGSSTGFQEQDFLQMKENIPFVRIEQGWNSSVGFCTLKLITDKYELLQISQENLYRCVWQSQPFGVFIIYIRLHVTDALGAVNHDAMIVPHSCLHIGHTFQTHTAFRVLCLCTRCGSSFLFLGMIYCKVLWNKSQ